MEKSSEFIQFFRQAAPYINQHRGKTFVFCIQDDDKTEQYLKSLLHDIALLQALRVRVVLILGVRYKLNSLLGDKNLHKNCRITDKNAIKAVQQTGGERRILVEAILSMGLANTPMQGAQTHVCSGNFVLAKPLGVREGIDFGFSGEVRKVRANAIEQHLDNGEIVLISPLGYSATGEVFNLRSEAVAAEVAVALQADKLLFINEAIIASLHKDHTGQAITPEQARQLSARQTDALAQSILAESARLTQSQVKRVHIIPPEPDGELLAELFTRDGVGLMITEEAYDRIEQATVNDITGLLQLIRPLEKQGILVRRSRELLEMEITSFSLLKRDNTIIGCAALYLYPKERMAELGCLVVAPEYRQLQLADRLLTHIEQLATQNHVEQLFCLTTQTSHWFMERGFEASDLSALPEKKQQFYNFSRNSKPYIKTLTPR